MKIVKIAFDVFYGVVSLSVPIQLYFKEVDFWFAVAAVLSASYAIAAIITIGVRNAEHKL